ncbi:MAG: MIP/aquaporin family protein [Niabella sp.]
MNIFTSELIGTAILIVLGNGVVANVVLSKTKGHNSGWIVITFGWAMAVFAGVFISSKASGAHLNPAVTLALVWLAKIEPGLILQYISGQMLGAMLGSLLVWLIYKQHYSQTEDTVAKLATFSTIPAIRNPFHNLLTETLATFIFILAVLFIIAPDNSLGALDALPVALLVLAIGLSLGGATGYAINPARDLGPRIMHAILPIGKKGSSDWAYSWVPVVGPVTGGILAAIVFEWISKG